MRQQHNDLPALSRALDAFAPWTSGDYPGRTRITEAIAGCTRQSISHWRLGHRRPAVEVVERVAAALESRIASDTALLAELRAELVARRAEPPSWTGVVTYWRKRRPAPRGDSGP